MKRFQRPINQYSGADDLLYRDKYQQDSKSVPKIAISSSKIDGDFNYLTDAVNTLDEDIKSVVHSGIANQTIEAKHIADSAISEAKMAKESINAKALKPGCVTNAKVADLAITTAKIFNNSVTKDKMASDSVGTDEVVDKSITRDKLADDAISDSVPVGAIAQFSVEPLPTGWILCNGATISKNTYPQLVKFLTKSDVTLSATLPNLNTDANAVTKFAIKAFSDTIELANLEIAGLTQDVAKLQAVGEEVVLWEGKTVSNDSFATLSESAYNFKYLIVVGYNYKFTNNVVSNMFLMSSITLGNGIYLELNAEYMSIILSTETRIDVNHFGDMTLTKVIGVR